MPAADDRPESRQTESRPTGSRHAESPRAESQDAESQGAESGQAEPIDRVAELVAAARAHARPLREVIALLTERPHTPASLISATAVSHRGVQAVLDALGADLVEDDQGFRISASRVPSYRDRFGYEQLRRTRLTDPLAARLAEHPELLAELERLIEAEPAGRRELDHVSATAETVARRALWLDSTFDLAGSRLLCVGDHDLTSLATARLNPELSVTVVDVDERILAFIDGQARRLGLDVRCWYADLRFGLPRVATGWADLLFTDPPYSPEGVRLFLARGLAGLRDRQQGRLVTAYGHGETRPGLGLKVQRAMHELHLVHEAILPDFNRYAGAQAVGSASDLYVSRPTSRTWKAFDAEQAGAAHIYTHGAQPLEGVTEPPDPASTDALCRAASGPDQLAVAAVVAETWRPDTKGIAHVRLGTLLSSGLPRVSGRPEDTAVAVDLTADPGSWLSRALLATNAQRVAVLVDNTHPDVTSQAAQSELAGLVGAKYTLRFRRNTPDSRSAIVEATVAPPAPDPAGRLTRRLLDRAHGKIGNVWREALASAAGLTKNDARNRIQRATRRPELLDARALDLPRHLLVELLADLAGSAADGAPG